MRLDEGDESVGRGVVGGHGRGSRQLRLDHLSELLAQLNSPLIVAVDIPADSLHEDLVFVACDESAESERIHEGKHDRGGRAVALEHLVRGDLLGNVLLPHCLNVLAGHQSLSLSEEIGQKNLVVETISDRVERLGGSDEIGRNETSALVYQLVECVLAVRARLAPHDRARRVVDTSARSRDELAVALHVSLLEVGSEAMEIPAKGQKSVRLRSVHIAVENAQHSHDHRNILLEGRLLEVSIDQIRASQKLLEVVEANVDGDREADGRPEGVTATNPIPELEHVGGVDAELGGLGDVGGEGDEVLRHVGGRGSLGEEPLLGCLCIRDRLLSRERFRRNDEESCLRRETRGHLNDVCSIDVADEVDLGADLVVAQGLSHHQRTQIRSSDADVDDISDLLASVASPGARDDRSAELLHVSQHAVDIGHHILSLHENGRVSAVAKRDVKHSTVLGEVDLLAAEHRSAHLLDTTRANHFDEQVEGLLRDAVLREVEEHRARGSGKSAAQLLETGGILGELVLHLQLRLLVGLDVRDQTLEGGVSGEGHLRGGRGEI
ncbi:hypothetical protein PMAYCL1PPCAC_26113, partial [Pristionchus mayeri]